jgi:hypothetical protein
LFSSAITTLDRHARTGRGAQQLFVTRQFGEEGVDEEASGQTLNSAQKRPVEAPQKNGEEVAKEVEEDKEREDVIDDELQSDAISVTKCSRKVKTH